MKPEIASAMIILAIAAYIDWEEHRVPNWLTFTAWGLGLLFHLWMNGWSGLSGAFLGSVVGLLTLIVPYALCGMGAGDVKLMAAVGAWVGAAMTVDAFLWIAIAGGVMGSYSILCSQEWKARAGRIVLAGSNLFTLNPLDSGEEEQAPPRILLPYGVPIAIGFYACFFFGGLL